MIEVEVKFKLRDKESFEEKLKNLGASYVADIIHTDTYYNLPKGVRDFTKTDEALRLRRTEKYDVRASKRVKHDISADLTYKGPRIDTETKTRKELITDIGDPDELDSIFQSLDFQPILTLTKHRRLYSLNADGHKIELLVDKIAHLDGYYAECEIITPSIDELEKNKSILFLLMEKLGYSKSDSILASYLELVAQKLNEKGNFSPQDDT